MTMWAAQGANEKEIVARLQARVPDFNLRGVPGGVLNWAMPLGIIAFVSLILIGAIVRLRKRSTYAARPPIDDRTLSELEDSPFADVLDDELADID